MNKLLHTQQRPRKLVSKVNCNPEQVAGKDRDTQMMFAILGKEEVQEESYLQ